MRSLDEIRGEFVSLRGQRTKAAKARRAELRQEAKERAAVVEQKKSRSARTREFRRRQLDLFSEEAR